MRWWTSGSDDARPAQDGAELGGVRNDFAHSGDSALFDEVGEKLQLADAFQVGDFRRDSGFDQR